MTEPTSPRLIFVGEQPFRIWRSDVPGPQFFLAGFDPSYFEKMADLLEKSSEGEDAWPVHLTLRNIYGQAIEAFFALLFSMLQAPWDTAARLLLYKPSDIRFLLGRFEAEARDRLL